jgi:hypothetical protein
LRATRRGPGKDAAIKGVAEFLPAALILPFALSGSHTFP